MLFLSRSTLLALPFLCLLSIPVSGADSLCEDIPSKAPRQGDLDCVERWIDVEQSWPKGAKVKAKTRLAKLQDEATELTDAQYFLRIAGLVALADNGHTGLSLAAARESFGLLPIRTYFFDDGLFIVRATMEHKELIGAQVLRIAGRSPSQLMDTMRAYFGGPAESFKVYGHTVLFLSPALLHAAGVIESPERIPLRVRLADGESRSVELEVYETDKQPAGYPWRNLHPDPIQGEQDDWVTWSTETAAELPWALEDPKKVFRYRHLPEARLAHIQFRANTSAGGVDIKDFLAELEKRLQADRPTFLLWDQRWNSGGDLSRTADFARRVHTWLPKDGRVFVATSNATFSAGIYTAFFPEWADDERTVVLGTRAGDRERFWAESRGPMVLPQSNWRIFYSLGLHDLADGCDDRKRCHIRKKRWKVAVGSFNPEVEIPFQSQDLPAGRDAVFEHVMKEIQDHPRR